MLEQADILALLQAFAASDLPLPGKFSGKVPRRLRPARQRPAADYHRPSLGLRPHPRDRALQGPGAQSTGRLVVRAVDRHPAQSPARRAEPNASIVTLAKPFSVEEVVVRGYITGVTTTALWHRYALGERLIYGYRFPDGLHNQALPHPIITPTTKGGPHRPRTSGSPAPKWSNRAGWTRLPGNRCRRLRWRSSAAAE